MVAYIVNYFHNMRPQIPFAGGGRGEEYSIIQRYIHQPGYVAGLIHGPRGPCYNIPLYLCMGLSFWIFLDQNFNVMYAFQNTCNWVQFCFLMRTKAICICKFYLSRSKVKVSEAR